MKLKGIIETSLGGFLTFRAFASFKEIARVSKPDESYQREIDKEYNEKLNKFFEDGANVFFPELILGFKPEDEYIEKMKEISKKLNANQSGSFPFFLGKIKLDIKIPKPSQNSSLKDNFNTATLSTTSKVSNDNLFFRIDGNHRISSFERLNLDDILVPVCIILFIQEYQKQSRVLFHNLNFKGLPLSIEENLKRIFEDEENFSDETLENDKSLGKPYLYAKKASNFHFNKYFPNIEKLLKDNERSSFLEFFKFLESKNCDEVDMQKLQANLGCINSIFENEELSGCKNANLFLAFLYYQVRESKKIKLFEEWVLKNHIYKAKIDLESLINIFDEIYKSRIQKIFVAMPFAKEYNNIWDSIVQVHKELSQTYELNDTPYRVDKIIGESIEITQEIKDKIKECDVMIADLSTARPNVYYELGLFEAQGKKFILLFDENTDENNNKVHFDLMTMKRVKYSSKDLENLKEDLKKDLESVLKEHFTGKQ